MYKELNVALLLGNGVEEVCDSVMKEVGKCVRKWWLIRKDLLYGELMDGFWSPLLPQL